MGLILGKVSLEMPRHEVVRKAEGYEIWRFPSQVSAVVCASDLDKDANGKWLRDKAFTSAAFPLLASYIGVFRTPQNRRAVAPDADDTAEAAGAEKVAMTTPVIVTPGVDNEKIAMTAPVIITPGVDNEKIAMTAPVIMTPGEESSHTPAADGAEPAADGAEPAADGAEPAADGAEPATTPERPAQSMKFLLPADKYQSVAEAPVPTNAAVKLQRVDGGRCEAVITFSGYFDMASSGKQAKMLLDMLKRDGVDVVGDWNAQGYNPPFTPNMLKRNEVHVPVGTAPYLEESVVATETLQ